MIPWVCSDTFLFVPIASITDKSSSAVLLDALFFPLVDCDADELVLEQEYPPQRCF